VEQNFSSALHRRTGEAPQGGWGTGL